MNKRRKKYKIKVVPVVIATIILIVILAVLISVAISLFNKTKDDDTNITSGGITEVQDDKDDKDEIEETKNDKDKEDNSDDDFLPKGHLDDWNLLLLNSEEGNNIPKDIPFEKVKFDTQYLFEKLNDPYTDMYEAAKKDGITLYLRLGYRSIADQQVHYQASIQRSIEQGMTRDEAIVQTELTTAAPGRSEHHTGLALDLITPEYHMHIYNLDESFAETAAYYWLIENSVNYGFVLRYPADKTEITKRSYEPWHFRYVGVEHALFMKEHNLCLEEYIDLLKEYGRDEVE